MSKKRRLQGSESFAEWLQKAEAWRAQGGEGVWIAMTDIAAQVSDVRHDHSDFQTSMDTAIWGDEDGRFPSKFDQLRNELHPKFDQLRNELHVPIMGLTQQVQSFMRVMKWALGIATFVMGVVSAALILHFGFHIG